MAVPFDAPQVLARGVDDPLPPELTGRTQGWLTRYRRYPVFSAPWVRGRLRAWTVPVALVLSLVLLPATLGSPAPRPWGVLLHLSLAVFLPLLAGPLLGLWVRRRGLSPDREWQALCAVFVALVLGMALFDRAAAEPLKQWLAERTGDVDDSGRRRKVRVAIGLVVLPDEAAAGTDGRSAEPTASHATTTAVNALLTFWMGGGLGLIGWRRERAGLASLAREQELARAQAQRREAELRLSVLAAQVEPHFLFNTLAGVRSAIVTDPVRASEMIDRLVEYLRAAIPQLRSDGASATTLGGQLETVRAYLGLMSARMTRLSFAIDAPAELLAAPCPPLMLISLAENAVKHGVEPKVGPVRIDVRAARAADGRLEVTVADDGAGFGVSAGGGGLGLVNIRDRMRQMYGDRASLALRTRPGGGVAAVMTWPTE